MVINTNCTEMHDQQTIKSGQEKLLYLCKMCKMQCFAVVISGRLRISVHVYNCRRKHDGSHSFGTVFLAQLCRLTTLQPYHFGTVSTDVGTRFPFKIALMDVHRWPTHENLFSSVSCVTLGDTRDPDEWKGSVGEGHHARLFWVSLTNFEVCFGPRGNKESGIHFKSNQYFRNSLSNNMHE